MEKKNVNGNASVQGNTLSSSIRKKDKRNICQKISSCMHVGANYCESYASRLLRVSFFTMNVVMLRFCAINLN